ncbi:transglutaminase family protein [Hyphobacterium sp.]|uniref:transglutaminase family protein n=1 Tax=Hyphobacterium sp. TaxID=2004662 RepID=UPI003BAD2D2A
MKLNITHATRYAYKQPVSYGLQQVRLTPTGSAAQNILSWSLDIEGGRKETRFTDQHDNQVDLISLESDEIVLTVTGEVETAQTAGVYGPHSGATPLWYFLWQTELTKPGNQIETLLGGLEDAGDDVARLHALSQRICEVVKYDVGAGDVSATAEDVLAAGHGVCQDHAHVFLAAARKLGFPSRYVSGYLMMNDRIDQDASHAWVESHVDGLGWVGLDISNGISPDERYVRLATGLDYRQAAPISGLVYGGGRESMIVSIQVQQ